MFCSSVFDWIGKKRKNFNPSEAPPASSPPPCPPKHLPMLSLPPGRAVITTQRPFPLCFSAVSTKLVGGKDQSWNLCWSYLEPSSTFARSARWGYNEPCSSPTTSLRCSLATNGHLPQHLAQDSLLTSLECELPKSAVGGRGMMGSKLHRLGYEFQLCQVLAESQLPYLKNGNNDSHLKRLQ